MSIHEPRNVIGCVFENRNPSSAAPHTRCLLWVSRAYQRMSASAAAFAESSHSSFFERCRVSRILEFWHVPMRPTRSACRPERLEFLICSAPLNEALRTVARREQKQVPRLVLRAVSKRPFAADEIGFADLTRFRRRVRIIGGGGSASGDRTALRPRERPCIRAIG
jgi:hypothetical protein